MPFKIQYKFKRDRKFYTCILTHEQFKNFKKLPIVKECEVIKEDQANVAEYMKEMDKAFEMAVKNDTSHIRRLSEVVS